MGSIKKGDIVVRTGDKYVSGRPEHYIGRIYSCHDSASDGHCSYNDKGHGMATNDYRFATDKEAQAFKYHDVQNITNVPTDVPKGYIVVRTNDYTGQHEKNGALGRNEGDIWLLEKSRASKAHYDKSSVTSHFRYATIAECEKFLDGTRSVKKDEFPAETISGF